MGCTPSSSREYGSPGQGFTHADFRKETVNSTAIDRAQEDDKLQNENKVKLLLLGAGESGKSTVFKQMRILHGSPRSEEDLKMYGVMVRHNIIVAIRKLCLLLRTLGLEEQLRAESAENTEVEDQERPPPAMSPEEGFDILIANVVSARPTEQPANEEPQAIADATMNGDDGETDWCGQHPRAGLAANNDAKLFLKYVDAIDTVWKTNTMKQVWAKRANANVIDGHKEYLQDLKRIASKSFRPTTQDVLLARVRTQQVIMERYTIDNIEFEMYDVGGQRSERRKWIDCFDQVDAVIFVAALSEYDQTLAESRRTNRMIEALELFRGVCNNRAFAMTSIMLFLNKKDIFLEKVMYSDISAQTPFADYAGPPKDFDHGVLYFIQKFKDCQIDNEFNDSFIHVTCATDTNNMEFVLDSTRMIIMTDNLRKSGILGND